MDSNIMSKKESNLEKFMLSVQKSFGADRKNYDKLMTTLFQKFDLNKVVEYVVELDNIELLDDILSNNVEIELNENYLIKLAAAKGRVTMGKAIYEFIHCRRDIDSSGDDDCDNYDNILELLRTYDFDCDMVENEKSIDSCVLLAYKLGTDDSFLCDDDVIDEMFSAVRCDFWNGFMIRYICEHCDGYVLKPILSDPRIDPGMHYCRSKFSLCELLRHPNVPVSNIDYGFVRFIIELNKVSVVEKIIATRYGKLFKTPKAIELLCYRVNDVTALAIKLGIIELSQIKKCKRKIMKQYLNEHEFNHPYVSKPYHLNFDSVDILEMAIKNNDIDSAKSIKFYSISIHPYDLLEYLAEYAHLDNDVCMYIWKHKLVEYDPVELLEQAPKHRLLEKVFNVVRDDPRLDLQLLHNETPFVYVKEFFAAIIKVRSIEAEGSDVSVEII